MAYLPMKINISTSGYVINIDTPSQELYGGTVTISKNGSTVGTTTFDNTGHAEYAVSETGTYTVSASYSGDTWTKDVVIGDAEVVIKATPNGSTVIPTNDIQTWLKCAEIWDKNYTTINEILSDATTLAALMLSHNAVDYLVRSTTWVSDITGNQTAMTDIGADDYCADTLLDDATWETAILASTYSSEVLTTKVPVMTDNTTPSGRAFASTSDSTAYLAFQELWTYARTWYSTGGTNQFIGYEFVNNVHIYSAVFTNYLYYSSGDYWGTYQCKVQYSDDNDTWVDATSVATIGYSSAKQTIQLPTNLGAHKYWRLWIVTSSSPNAIYASLNTLQFYGR